MAFFGILWHEHIYLRCIHPSVLSDFSGPNGSFYVLGRLGLVLLFDTLDLLLICGHSTPEHRASPRPAFRWVRSLACEVSSWQTVSTLAELTFLGFVLLKNFISIIFVLTLLLRININNNSFHKNVISKGIVLV